MAQALDTTTTARPAGRRHDDLQAMLEAHVRQLSRDLSGRRRDVRVDVASRPHGEQDFGEIADSDVQDEIKFALLEMKTETLNRMQEALARLAEGRYGQCRECGDEIAEARLRALPFAARCRDCESAREAERDDAQVLARRAAPPLFDARG